MSAAKNGLDVELKSPVAKVALFLVLLIVGAALTVWGVFTVREALDARSWPSVEGTVVVSEARHVAASRNPDRRSTYEPEVAVEYEVAGQSLVCDRITFATPSFERATHVHALLRPYSVGKKVDVHYDPDEPAKSVLEPRLAFTTFLLPAFGAVLVIGTIGAGVRSVIHRGHDDATAQR